MCDAAASRLLHAMSARGLSQAEVAAAAGVSPQYVNNVVRGRTGLSVRFAEQLADGLGVSPTYLLFGEGPMDAGEAVARLRGDRRVCVGEDEAFYTPRRAVRVPLVGRVSANPEPDVIWEAVEPREYRELPQGAVALEVRGDSMRPVAMPGQAVLAVDAAVENGDLVAVEMRDGRQMFKRWWWREGRRAAILESVRREAIEPPVPVKVRDCRHVWRVIGVLF